MAIFNSDLVYPRDETGCYVEFEGKIVKTEPKIEDLICEEIHDDIEESMLKVYVETPHGVLTGYWEMRRNQYPKIGYFATIRVYKDFGGGFYPDDKITGWRSHD